MTTLRELFKLAATPSPTPSTPAPTPGPTPPVPPKPQPYQSWWSQMWDGGWSGGRKGQDDKAGLGAATAYRNSLEDKSEPAQQVSDTTASDLPARTPTLAGPTPPAQPVQLAKPGPNILKPDILYPSARFASRTWSPTEGVSPTYTVFSPQNETGSEQWQLGNQFALTNFGKPGATGWQNQLSGTGSGEQWQHANRLAAYDKMLEAARKGAEGDTPEDEALRNMAWGAVRGRVLNDEPLRLSWYFNNPGGYQDVLKRNTLRQMMPAVYSELYNFGQSDPHIRAAMLARQGTPGLSGTALADAAMKGSSAFDPKQYKTWVGQDKLKPGAYEYAAPKEKPVTTDALAGQAPARIPTAPAQPLNAPQAPVVAPPARSSGTPGAANTSATNPAASPLSTASITPMPQAARESLLPATAVSPTVTPDQIQQAVRFASPGTKAQSPGPKGIYRVALNEVAPGIDTTTADFAAKRQQALSDLASWKKTNDPQYGAIDPAVLAERMRDEMKFSPEDVADEPVLADILDKLVQSAALRRKYQALDDRAEEINRNYKPPNRASSALTALLPSPPGVYAPGEEVVAKNAFEDYAQLMAQYQREHPDEVQKLSAQFDAARAKQLAPTKGQELGDMLTAAVATGAAAPKVMGPLGTATLTLGMFGSPSDKSQYNKDVQEHALNIARPEDIRDGYWSVQTTPLNEFYPQFAAMYGTKLKDPFVQAMLKNNPQLRAIMVQKAINAGSAKLLDMHRIRGEKEFKDAPRPKIQGSDRIGGNWG